MDGIDGRAEERNEFPACIFIINTPVWAIVGMERERRGSSKIDTTTLLLWLEKFDISSRGTVLTWTKCEKFIIFLLPLYYSSRASTSSPYGTSDKLRCIPPSPMFHGDKSASKCFVPLGALFSPIPARRYRTRGCRCITNSARRI